MAWKIILVDSTGHEYMYGGDDVKKIHKLFSGYDLTLEDSSDKVEIGTPTTFYTDKFMLRSPTTNRKYIFRTKDITADRYISLPLMTDDGEIALAATTTQNDWGNNLQTYRNQYWKIMNPANTFGYILNTSAIAANINLTYPQLTTDDTFVFCDATQTLNNKTLVSPTISAMNINVDSNTLKHSTTNTVGDLLSYDGTRYNRLARGAANQLPIVNPTATGWTWIDKASLGAGGGGGGTVTGDHLVPLVSNVITGAWYGTNITGGTGCWTNFLTNTSNITPSNITDSSGRMGLRFDCTSDDNRLGFRTNDEYFSRQNNPELWVRYKYYPLSATHTETTNYRVVIGFTSDVSAGYDADGALNNKSAFMWFKEKADTIIQVGHNDGDSVTDKHNTVQVSQTDSTVRTIRVFGDDTNSRFGISLDGANATYFDTEIPAQTTRLGCIVQFENEGEDDRSFELYGAYFKCTVI